MSDTRNDGGPAFPRIGIGDLYYDAAGMSLRDWFAGQALAGFAAEKCSADQTAHAAYLMADAMLAARKETP